MSFETRFFYDVKLIVWGWRIGWRSGEAKKQVGRRKKFPNQPYAVRIDLRQDEEIYALNSFCEKESLRGFSKSMIFFYTHRSNRHPHYFDYALFNASSPVVRWCASAEVLGQMFLLFLYCVARQFPCSGQTLRRINSSYRASLINRNVL